jgi:hypothetical protein
VGLDSPAKVITLPLRVGGNDQLFDVPVGIDVGLEGLWLLRHAERQRATRTVLTGKGVAIEPVQSVVLREPEGRYGAYAFEKPENQLWLHKVHITVADGFYESARLTRFASNISRPVNAYAGCTARPLGKAS